MRLRALLAAGSLLLGATQTWAQLPAGSIVVVLPFENPSGDARLQWLREGAAMLVSDALTATDADVVSRDERTLAYERLQLPLLATLSRASTIKVGLAVGATILVVGRLEVAGDELIVAARAVRLDTGRLQPEVVERGRLADLFGIVPRVVRGLTGAATANAATPVPPSLAAFELYVKGLSAELTTGQRSLLEQAVKAAPNYDAARLALWRFHTDQGDHQRALDVTDVARAGARRSREARFAAALSMMQLHRLDDAYSALRTLNGEESLPAIANAIGVVQIRRGGGTAQTGRATYYFNQAAELDPSAVNYFFNLGYAYWIDRDPKASIYWMREAVRRDPGDGDAHFVLSAALQTTGAVAEANRERELARRLASRYASAEARPAGGDPVPRGLERLQQELDRPSTRVDTILASTGQRDHAALAAFHLDAARRAFDREDDREALRELRRALFLSPYLTDAHVLLGRVHLRAGRNEDAVEACKIALWSEQSIEAHLLLAEAYLGLEDVPAARAEVDRALALEPGSDAARRLRDKLATPR